MNCNDLEKTIEYVFFDKTLLQTALTHSSASGCFHQRNNQRLEFLGDAVLQLTISKLLYESLPDAHEGELSKKRALIVCADSLCEAGKKIDLEQYLILGKGEENSGGRNKKNIVADAMESLIAAIFLDGGMAEASAFIISVLSEIIERAKCGELTYDYKTVLQEYVQNNSLGELKYVLLSTKGPEHDMVFTSQAEINGRIFPPGEGKNRKEAEQKAASLAYDIVTKF